MKPCKRRRGFGISLMGLLACTAALNAFSIDSALAEELTVRFVIQGALDAGMVLRPAEPVGLDIGMVTDRPVFLVSNGEILGPAIGTADYVSIVDPAAAAPWGSAIQNLFLDLGGLYVYGTSVVWNDQPLATVSAGNPLETLSGTWTAFPGTTAGIDGVGPVDLVVDMTVDLNEGGTVEGVVSLLLKGILPLVNGPSTVTVAGDPEGQFIVTTVRDNPVHIMDEALVGGPVGTVSYYEICLSGASGQTCLGLRLFSIAGLPVLAPTHHHTGVKGLTCAVAGGGVLERLAGDCSVLGGSFLVGTVDGITADDQRWMSNFTLP